ncbi:MAG: hypothetical protein D6713_04270, partial [Deltaproteobacteria bacterium]
MTITGWQSGLISRVPGLHHFFGGRGFHVGEGGDETPPYPALGFPSRICLVEQVHSSRVVSTADLVPGERNVQADGIVLE